MHSASLTLAHNALHSPSISYVKEAPGVQIRHARRRAVDMDVVTRCGAGRPIAMCACMIVDVSACWLATYGLLRAWILQDLRRTEMRGYGVGGNEKGHDTLAKWPNKGNAG